MDIQELVVRATPEGMSDVNDGLNSMEQSTNEVTDSMEQTSGELSDLSRKFKGSMSAIMGGFALAAGGLLSKVPVIGESMDSLGMVLDALALSIDKELRPALSKFNDDQAETAEEVNEADGIFASFKAAVDGVGQSIQDITVSGLQKKIKDLTGIKIPENWLDFGWDVITMDFDGAIQNLKSIVNDFVTLDFEDGTFMDKLVNQVRKSKKHLTQRFNEIKSNIGSTFDSLVSDAKSWGSGLIERFVEGIKNRVPDLGTTLDNIGNGIGSVVPGVGGGSSGLSGSGSDSTGPSVQGFIGSVGGSSPAVYLDGSRVDDNQGRFRKGSLTRRGR
jgi:archaellum component FlaC